MLHFSFYFCRMVLYILTGYQVLGIVYLDQLTGARHTHTYLIRITCRLLQDFTSYITIAFIEYPY